MRVGFIGAGRMGRPMVARLVEAGHDVRVVGRTDEQRRSLELVGARPVSDAAQAGARADVVLVCVFTDDQVRQVCLDGPLLATMPPGSTLAVHTTASPSTIEAIAARAGDVGVVDAPVSGGPHDIAAGRLTLFVGGTDEAVARVRPVLGCYGDPVLHVGPLGAGQKVKLVNNALFAGHIGLLAESIRLGERLGVPESTLLNALPHGSATSRVLDIVAAGGSIAAFVEVAGEFVGKDVAVARGVAAELGSDLGALDEVIGRVGPLASNTGRV
ncbi:NAD(P)-dependent oxidoreductase [Mycobacterium terramassiliense]|uniref:3-hydroxyisobutyrate dehydrogenase or related beta-hydroxyacid dehydrogenase n=1 Tax=Mycobacterium terramassiliense TaxID=1841859 RepID=A0A2U3NGV7_9MYCO|nr:NAD(P)-dependent oxidoreductase [Mycobacterium terramassiliense]SPM30756.1 3-hydroxyisobutyrate dehydrogenase or related beta-hydroxyacid dehydrogenase [Mycobacterium terramassiliense]